MKLQLNILEAVTSAAGRSHFESVEYLGISLCGAWTGRFYDLKDDLPICKKCSRINKIKYDSRNTRS